jgi:RHS repeat-associated protein
MYMQARYYDPVIGRFYSNDPVDVLGHMQRGNSIAHGFNRYGYANNNPYKYVDPDGEFVWFVAAAVVAYAAYEGYQEGGAKGAVAEASGYNDAVDSINSISEGDFSGAAVSMAAAFIKPVKALKTLSKSQIKNKNIDAEQFKADQVGSKEAAKFNMAVDKDGNVSLVPVKKGASEPIPTNQNLKEVEDQYQLEDRD